MQRTEDAAASFASTFRNHHRKCVSLAKQFAIEDPSLKDSVALEKLCRASQEMLDQAKAARALTEIYVSLDEKHRDVVRPIIIGRFKDILKSAEASWKRFCDSIQFIRPARSEIESARRNFEPHADEFQDTLRRFIELGDKTV